MTTSKICTTCNQRLPADQFNKDNSRPDGLRSRCKTCRTRLERKGATKTEKVNGFHLPFLPDVPVKNRETAYRQALIDLHYKYPEDFKELLQTRLREFLTR